MSLHKGHNRKNRNKLQNRILSFVHAGHDISETQRMVQAGTLAIRAASERAFKVAGYALIVEGNSVVRVERGGRKTKVSEIESIPRPEVLILD